MKLTGDNYAAVCADLDGAIGELIATVERDPARWTRGNPGKWTGGQHAAHVLIALQRMLEPFAAAEPVVRAGTLPPPPGRGLGESMFLTLIVAKGWMPRGAKAPSMAFPPDHPDRVATLAALRRDADQLRAIGERLSPAERDRLWITNPFRPVWHYRLPEAIRMQAVHARHHHKQIVEIPAG